MPVQTFAVAVAAALLLGEPLALARQTAPAPSPAPVFICPEDQPDDAARAAELSRYFRSAPAGTSIFDITQNRLVTLQQHGCKRTLSNMQAHEAAVLGGAVRDQAWFPLEHTPDAALDLSVTYLKTFLDPRAPGEKAVDAYSRIKFSKPQVTNATHTTIDEVVSREVYYCATERHALVRNDYFLAGVSVLVDPTPGETVGGVTVWPTEPNRPGTLNADVAAAACGGLRATPS